jgi:hypothetical protein
MTKLKSMKKFFLTAIAVVLVFSACKKDDEVKLSNFEMLTAHKWKYSEMTRTIGTVSTDLLAGSCEADDILEFKSNYELHFESGAQICYPSQPATGFEPYSLSENHDTIYSGNADPIYIKSLSLNKMEWEIKWVEDQVEVLTTVVLIEP